MQEPEVQIVSNAQELAERAAAQFVELARAAIEARGVFTWCASGGQTPRGVYTRLAQPELANQLDWQRMQIYFGDERCVPPDDAQSNFRMLRETLLAHVPVPEAQVFRIAGELEPETAARNYTRVLQERLGVSASGTPQRTFDLVFLGLGTDAHTASLFPGSSADPDARVWASARQKPDTRDWRVTLSASVLNAASCAMFLISGADKAVPLAEVLRGPRDLQRLPAQRVRPRGHLIFCVDRAAATRL